MKVITKVRVKKWCKKSGGDDRHKKVFDLLSSISVKHAACVENSPPILTLIMLNFHFFCATLCNFVRYCASLCHNVHILITSE